MSATNRANAFGSEGEVGKLQKSRSRSSSSSKIVGVQVRSTKVLEARIPFPRRGVHLLFTAQFIPYKQHKCITAHYYYDMSTPHTLLHSYELL